MSPGAALLSFFLAAASCLAAGTAWHRLFALTFGGSPASAALATSALLLGLGLGGLAGGSLARRSRRPLLAYGALALASALLGLLIPPAIQMGGALLEFLHRSTGCPASQPLVWGLKGLAALSTLLPAGALWGVMAPLLVRHLARETGEVGAWMGSLLTLAALAGAAVLWLLAPILIPRLGLVYTPALFLLAQAAAALPVLLRGWRQPLGASPAEGEPPLAPVREPALAAWCLASAAGALFQLAAARLLLLGLGTTTYSEGLIGGVVCLGLLAGGMAGTLWADRSKRPRAALAWVLLFLAGSQCLAIPSLGSFPLDFAHWLSRLRLPMSLPLFLGLGGLSAALLIVPSAFFLALAFPLAGRLAAGHRGSVGRGVGFISGASGLGVLAATLFLGPVLLHFLGNLWAPLLIATVLTAGAGLALVLADPVVPARLALRAAAAAALVLSLGAFTFARGPWPRPAVEGHRSFDPLALSFGPLLSYRQAGRQPTVEALIQDLRSANRVDSYRDGAGVSAGVISRRGADPGQTLKVSGETEASSGSGARDLGAQVLLGHLLFVAHPGARSALTLGLGNGATLASMALHKGLERIVCFEPAAEVVEAAGSFSEAGRRPLEDRRVSLHSGDLTELLRHAASSFDAIACQPSGFWSARHSDLFTREFYALVNQRLSPDGLFCQRVLAARVSAGDFRTVLRTVLHAFPAVTLWTPGGEDVLLLCSRAPIEWRRDRIERLLADPSIALELSALGVDGPQTLFRCLRLEDAALRRVAGEGPENSSLVPCLEYSAPQGLFEAQSEVGALLAAEPAGLTAVLSGFDPAARVQIESFRRRGALLQALEGELSAGRFSGALVLFGKVALERDGWLSEAACQLLAHSSALAPGESRRFFLLDRALLLEDSPVLRLARGQLPPYTLDPAQLQSARKQAAPADWTVDVLLAEEALGRGDGAGAREALEAARGRSAPPHLLGQLQGLAWAAQGDLVSAEASFEEGLRAAPPGERGEILYNLGFCREKRRDFEGAVQYQRLSLGEGADRTRGNLALARCLRAAGRPVEALAAAEEASRKRESAEAFYEAARALMDLGNLKGAVDWMAQAAGASPERYLKELEALEARLR